MLAFVHICKHAPFLTYFQSPLTLISQSIGKILDNAGCSIVVTYNLLKIRGVIQKITYKICNKFHLISNKGELT